MSGSGAALPASGFGFETSPSGKTQAQLRVASQNAVARGQATASLTGAVAMLAG